MSTEKQKQDRLADGEFAFPSERKEPLSDAAHVRNAIARFDQVEGVTDEERDRAWQRIRSAAGTYGVHVAEEDWRDLLNPTPLLTGSRIARQPGRNARPHAPSWKLRKLPFLVGGAPR